jgi:antitoxin VapB
MGKEYTAKSFKSGNSVAIRLPAALGIEPDREWTVTEEDGELHIRAKEAPKRKFDIDKVWGCARGLGLQPIKPEDRVFEERPLLWDDPEWRARFMPDE